MSWEDRAKRKLEEASQGDFYKLGLGPNRFRTLPSSTWPNGGEEETGPIYFYLRHSDVGPNKKFATCGHWYDADGNLQGDCHLCDKVIPHLQTRDEKTAELAAAMEAKEYACIQVSACRDGRYCPPQKLEFAIGGGASYGAWIISKLVSERHYEHPSKGRDFIIVGSGGENKKRRYPDKEIAQEASVIPRAVFDARKAWEEIIHPYDVEYIKAMLAGREYKPAEADAWSAAVTDDTAGYDETAYAEGYAETAYAEDGAEAGYAEGTGYEEAGEGYAEAADGYAEAAPEATGYEEAAEGYGEATGYEEAAADDGYGTDESYADPVSTGEGDSPWDFNEPEAAPAPPPARKAPPAMKKAPPAMKKAGPPPPPPPPAMKKAPPAMKKGPAPAAPPQMMKKGGPPPVMKKGGTPPPPPAMKKAGPPPPPPAMKKAGPPQMMKKGGPPRR